MLASSPRLDIFWSPSDRDNYVVFGSELQLFKVDKVDSNNTDPGSVIVLYSLKSGRLMPGVDILEKYYSPDF